MSAESDGESLRNFDKKFHSKIRSRCEKTLQIKPAPYLREFTLKEDEKKSDKKVVKEKIREPWRKRAREKKSKSDKKNRKNDIGTFELSDKEKELMSYRLDK